MKKILFAALSAILAVGCTEKEAEDTLSLSSKEVTLAAAAGEVKTVTVDASNTWTFEQAADAAWLSVKRSDNTLSFQAVGDNKTEAEFRTTVKVKAGTKSDEIVVRQLAAEAKPVEPAKIEVDKTSVSFEGISEGASEVINVTLSEGLTFRTEKDAVWFTVTNDLEAKTITVTCMNNDTDAQRTGTIKVIASDQSLEPIVITVEQAGQVIDRHMFVYKVGDATKTPQTEFTTSYDKMSTPRFFMVDVYPYNLDWRIEISNDGKDYSWVTIKKESDRSFSVRCNENTAEAARSVTIRIVPVGLLPVEPEENPDNPGGGDDDIMPAAGDDVSDIQPVTFEIKQNGKPNYLSTLDGDVNVTFTDCKAGNPVLFRNLKVTTVNYSYWTMGLCSEGVVWGKDPNSFSEKYNGTGTRFMIKLDVAKYESEADTYIIPSGVYNISSEETAGNAIAGFKPGAWDSAYYSYAASCWYIEQEDGAIVKKAPAVSGTVTVSYDEATQKYTFVIDAKDDAEHSIKFSWTGTIENTAVN